MSFVSDLQRFADRTNQSMDYVVRSVILKMGESVIRMSPVGNPSIWKGSPPAGYVGGRFRANWQHNTGTPASGTIATVDPKGSVTVQKLAAALQGVTAGNIEYLTNNLPYSTRLEYGWSSQAPGGMVRVTVARFQKLMSEAAKEVK